MRRLLLISSSRVHGTGYLEHCASQLQSHFAGCRQVLFVPYAGGDLDAYAASAGAAFNSLGLELESIHRASEPAAAVAAAEGVFVGGGNTFRLLATLYAHGLLEPLRRRVAAGMPYAGASAGTNVAGRGIQTTNDMPIVYPPSFDALGLVPFNFNPHYLDPDPGSTHMGETRETRIREFHEVSGTPVLGLREGAMLRVEDGVAELLGSRGARLFRRGQEPEELATGDRLDFLLQP